MNVYFLRAGNRGAIKVGVARNVERRIASLQVGNPFKLNLLATIPCESRRQAYALESRIHRLFKSQNIRGEWFMGNIDFRKVNSNMKDFDTTRSSPKREKSTYVHTRKKRKRHAVETIEDLDRGLLASSPLELT